MAVEQIALADLKEKIAGSTLTIVDFYADWCGPCKQLAPILDQVASAGDGSFSIHKVNVEDEEFQDFTAAHRISSIPTVLFFKNGEIVHQFVGLQDEKSVKEMIEANK